MPLGRADWPPSPASDQNDRHGSQEPEAAAHVSLLAWDRSNDRTRAPNTKLRHAGRPPMPLPALLKLPNPPAPQGADDRVRLPNKRRTAYDAALHFKGMLFTVGRPTLRIHPLPVPIPPLPGRRTVTLATPRRPAQLHPPVQHESLERQPLTAAGAAPMRRFPYPATTRASSSRVSLLRGFLGGGRWASVGSSGTPPRGGGILKP